MLRRLVSLQSTTRWRPSTLKPLRHISSSPLKSARQSRWPTSIRSQPSHPTHEAPAEGAFIDVLLKASRSYTPLIFATTVGVGFYAFAADRTNKDTIEWSKKIRTVLKWTLYPPTTSEMVHAKNVERRDSLSDGLKSVKEWTSGMSKAVSIEIQRAYVMFANAYLALPEASRTCYAITTVNALIFLAWKVPRWQTFMMRHFLHDPLSGRSYTLLTSVFSHQSFPHLLFNSLALNSFGAAFDVVDSQRPDVLHMAHSTNRWHFLGFYLGAGLFASTLSHVVSTRIVLPRLLKALADPAKASALKPNEAMISPSLGASGAIYGVVAMTALALPETNISLIFLPMVPFPITFGVGGMVALDIIGIIRGWKMFDHWAHLGGALSGAIYFYHAPWEWVRAKLWPLRV